LSQSTNAFAIDRFQIVDGVEIGGENVIVATPAVAKITIRALVRPMNCGPVVGTLRNPHGVLRQIIAKLGLGIPEDSAEGLLLENEVSQ
jgi:hypothetical protein